MVEFDDLQDWERLLAAERHLQLMVPGSVLVGGTAAALHAGHRVSLDGILTGIRQLRRTRPLETEELSGLTIPTLPEMARIKAWLLATRHTVRDYLDTVVLFHRLGEEAVERAMAPFDDIYEQTEGVSVLSEVAERLAAAAPSDLPEIDLETYRGVGAPWNDWDHVAAEGRRWAVLLARVAMEGPR